MPIFFNATPSNYEVLQATQQLVKVLNATPGWLRLFKNFFTPAYASPFSAFTEANFSGYSPLSLSGAFADPAKQVDGLYASATSNFSWMNSGIAAQMVYGYWISAGVNWYFAGTFASPINLLPSQTLTVSLTWQGLALGLVLP